MHDTFEYRFKESFIVNDSNDCWEFIKVNSHGYGHIMRNGKIERAHRAAWSHFKGNIPKGFYVLHKCDNRRCVNYKKHLYTGTAKNNMFDYMSRNPGAKLHLQRCQKAGREGAKKFWRSMSSNERKLFCKRRGKIRFANMTSMQRKQQLTKFQKAGALGSKQFWTKMTPVQRACFIQRRARKIKSFWNNITPAKKRQHLLSCKKAAKIRWGKIPSGKDIK